MRAQVTDRGEVVLVGRLDVRGSAVAREALRAALETGEGELVVDLAEVELLDATGLGVLVATHRRARAADRRLVLRDASPRVTRMLALTRIDRIIASERPGRAVRA
jgi:anti-sigma B factor antagonist